MITLLQVYWLTQALARKILAIAKLLVHQRFYNYWPRTCKH